MNILDALIGLEVARIPNQCLWEEHEWIRAYSPEIFIRRQSPTATINKTVQLSWDICKHCHKRSNDKD